MDGLGSFTGIRGFRSRGQLGAWMAGGGVSAVSPSSAAAMAAAMVVFLGELGSVCLSQRGRVEREGGNACCASSRERRGSRAQGDGEVAHGTARRVVTVARRAAVLDVRAGRWRRVEGPRGFGRTQGRGGLGARRGSGAWPTARRRRRHGGQRSKEMD